MPVCIEARDYGFRYDAADEPQLRNLTFAIRQGERVAIMGATGAGKTTLAMSLNGLVPHHHEGEVSGHLCIDGHDVAATTITQLVRDVGLVMQDAEAQVTGRTVGEDAAVGPANLGLPKHEVLIRARAALEQVGMGGLERRATSQLSGGQLQRLAIAGILAMKPRILVLDEPTSELDPAGAAQVLSVLHALSDEPDGPTVILVTHEPELVMEWASRLLVLGDGRLIYDGAPAAFFVDTDLVRRSGVRQPGVVSAVVALREAEAIAAIPLPVTMEEAVALLRPHRRAGEVVVAPRDEPPVAPKNPPVLRTVALSHRYPSGVVALAGVSVDIHEGEFVALLGANGAGKTTFARHLNGLLRPTTGIVEVNGRATAGRPVHELAAEVGYVFQNPDHQIFAASVFDEVAFGLRNRGVGEREIAERVQAVAHRVGLDGQLRTHPYRLGKGQRQRLAVASVLATEPGMLVIDEPTTGQDWSGSLATMELVQSLSDEGHTILMITHDMALAARYARRALVFDQGRIVADRDMRALLGDGDLLHRARLARPHVTELAVRLGLSPVGTPEDFVVAWGAVG